jgi:hypothetical protein
VPSRITFDYSKLKAKLESFEPVAKRIAHAALVDFVEALKNLNPAYTDARRAEHIIGKRLAQIFIPHDLLGERREEWPDLREIYNARYVYGYPTYKGRRLFDVDRLKLRQLQADLVRDYLGEMAFDKRGFVVSETGDQITATGPSPDDLPAAEAEFRRRARESSQQALAESGLRPH